MKYSTIFKTITDDSTKAIKTMGFFGKSLANIKRDISSGQNKIYSIFGGNHVTPNDIKQIQEYTKLVKQGIPIGQAWNDTMKGCSVAAKQQVLSCKNSTVALEKLTVAQKENTISAKASQIALKGLALAGNMITFALIGKGIQLATEAIDNHIHRNEIAIEKANELKSSLDASISFINEKEKSLKNLSERFIELSKGVDEYGNVVALTSDESKEYKSIVEELIGLNPSIVKGYNAEGEAIIDKNSALQDTVELLKQEKQLELEKTTSSE